MYNLRKGQKLVYFSKRRNCLVEYEYKPYLILGRDYHKIKGRIKYTNQGLRRIEKYINKWGVK